MSQQPPEQQKPVSVLIIAKDQNQYGKAAQFLSRRGWPAHVVPGIKQAVEYVVKNRPMFVMVSFSIPNANIVKLPALLEKTFGAISIAFGETGDPKTTKRLNTCKMKHIFYGAMSGPSIHMRIKKILIEMEKEKQQANQPQKAEAQTPEHQPPAEKQQAQQKPGGDVIMTGKDRRARQDMLLENTNQNPSNAGPNFSGGSHSPSSYNPQQSGYQPPGQGGASNTGSFNPQAQGADSASGNFQPDSNAPYGSQPSGGQHTNQNSTNTGSYNPQNNSQNSLSGNFGGDANSSPTGGAQPTGENQWGGSEFSPDGNSSAQTQGSFNPQSNGENSTSSSQSTDSYNPQQSGYQPPGQGGASNTGSFNPQAQGADSASGNFQPDSNAPYGSQPEMPQEPVNNAGFGEAANSMAQPPNYPTSANAPAADHAPADHQNGFHGANSADSSLNHPTDNTGIEAGTNSNGDLAGASADVAGNTSASHVMPPRKMRTGDQKTNNPNLKDMAQTFDRVFKENCNVTKEEPQLISETSVVEIITIRSEETNGYLIFARPEGSELDQGFFSGVKESIQIALRNEFLEFYLAEEFSTEISQISFIQWASMASDFVSIEQHEDMEIAMAYFSEDVVPHFLPADGVEDMSMVNINSLVPDLKSDYKGYINFEKNGKMLLYIKKGRSITQAQKERLIQKNVKNLYVPNDDVKRYCSQVAQATINQRIEQFVNYLKQVASSESQKQAS